VIHGIDIASEQHPDGAAINYEAVVGVLRSMSDPGATPFVFVKLTEGVGYVNPWGLDDVAGFDAAGAFVGGYAFDHPGVTPTAEVAWFRAHTLGGLTVRVVDAETTDGLTGASVAQHVAQVLADDPGDLLYSYPSFLDADLAGEPWGHLLWLADPNHPAGSPSRPCVIQQYGQGTISGIVGQVDMDVWMSTPQALAALFNGVSPVAEGVEMLPKIVTDPTTGGGWVVTADGGVQTVGGAPFLGSLTTHPEWNAGGSNDRAVDAVWFQKPGTTDPAHMGLRIITIDTGGIAHSYDLPASGVYATRP
jgi:lysozyme